MGMHAIHFDPCRRHKTKDADKVVNLRKLLAPLLQATAE
jgi:hypothetical protein